MDEHDRIETRIVVSEEAFARLSARMDEPPKELARLRDLLREKAPWKDDPS